MLSWVNLDYSEMKSLRTWGLVEINTALCGIFKYQSLSKQLNWQNIMNEDLALLG